jgi:membrane protein required for colicin V production
MSPVNIADSILVILFSLFALRGYFKGLFRETFSLIGFAAGLMAAVRYDEPLAALWAAHWNPSHSVIVLRILAFVAIFFSVYIVSALSGWLLHRSAGLVFLQGVNRIGGVLLGAAKGVVLVACLVFVLLSSPWLPQSMRTSMDESRLASPLYHLARLLIAMGTSALFPDGVAQGVGREIAGDFF